MKTIKKINYFQGRTTKSITVYNYMQVEKLKNLNKSEIMQNVLFHWSLKFLKHSKLVIIKFINSIKKL